jgi:hypothetical protein
MTVTADESAVESDVRTPPLDPLLFGTPRKKRAHLGCSRNSGGDQGGNGRWKDVDSEVVPSIGTV